MSKFNVGDRITHPEFGGAVVKIIPEYGDPRVKRDDGVTGSGKDGLWIAMSDAWMLEGPALVEAVPTEVTETELDERRLQAIFVNTSATLQAIDSGEIPEDQVIAALSGMGAAYVQWLGQRFGSTLDECIAARRASIAEFAA